MLVLYQQIIRLDLLYDLIYFAQLYKLKVR